VHDSASREKVDLVGDPERQGGVLLDQQDRVNPMMDRIRVVFPPPLRLRIPTTWRLSTRRETPWRT
jgi:hypothetical protein